MGKEHDPSTATLWLERLRPELLAWLRRRLRDADTAEDLCQETLTRFVEHAPDLREPDKARAYVFQTARNLLANHFRDRRSMLQLEVLDGGLDPRQRADSPQSDAEHSQLQEHLQNLLLALPPDQRLAFELGVLQRLAYAEIARARDWSVAKVKVDVYRARKTLAHGLREFRTGTRPVASHRRNVLTPKETR